MTDVPFALREVVRDLCDSTLGYDAFVDAICGLVLNERERCARVIENPNRAVMGIDEDALDFFTESMARIIREGVYDARPKGSEPEARNVS